MKYEQLIDLKFIEIGFLDSRYYNQNHLVIEKEGKGVIKQLKIGEEISKRFFIDHSELVQSNYLKISLQ